MKCVNHSLFLTKIIATLLLCTTSAVRPATAQLEVVDDLRGFTLTLDQGWQANPDFIRPEAGVVHAFQYNEAGIEEALFLLLIKEMPGTLGREPLDDSMMPPGFQGSLFKTQWQGFEVDGFEVPESNNGAATLTLNVQIPLKRAAIQVMLYGSIKDKAKLKGFLPVILSSLKGESSWGMPTPSVITPSKPAKEKTSPVPFIVVGLVVLIGLVLLWIVSTHAPRGTALAIAAIVFVIGWMLTSGLSREMNLVKGSLQIFGTVGILLGIVDTIKKT